MFLKTIMSQSRRTIRYLVFINGPTGRDGVVPQIQSDRMPCGVKFRHLTEKQQMHSHVSLVQVSANRASRSERTCVLGSGCSESTVTIRNPRLVNTSFASDGKLGVDMMTSGCLDPTRAKLSFNTRAAGKYELFVRRVTYAFFDSIQMVKLQSRNLFPWPLGM